MNIMLIPTLQLRKEDVAGSVFCVSLLFICSLDARPGCCHHLQLLSVTTNQKMSRRPLLSVSKSDDTRCQYKEAFSAFDWTNSGRISYGSLKVYCQAQVQVPFQVPFQVQVQSSSGPAQVLTWTWTKVLDLC